MTPVLGLSVRDLVVRYGHTRAVDHVDLDIEPGEVLALLGPSGSGKSSLLRAVAGLEPVAQGTIAWEGRDVGAVPVHRRGFGLMFQDGQLFAHRDVAGNVAYGLRHLSPAERTRRVADTLDLVGMGEYARRAVTSLSGGQAQRVALARSLAPQPALLLLDEPLSALDRSLRERLSGEIRAILRTTGSTCIYVTHDQDEAFAVADRVGVMVDGRLVALARPGDLWADPGLREVAEFLGHGPFLPATSVGDSEGSKGPRWRAVTPGALTVVGVEASPAPSTGEGALAPEAVAAGGRIELLAEVRDARAARGRTEVEVLVAGQVADAHIPQGPAVRVDADSLIGGWVRLALDLDACPFVTGGHQ
ncbi:ABC transporter ATP-binding protein [Schaalia sp. 19OD2882]|uniref:ABC transporter ATP-binding protein n=1 Tax=Schaalia sp. 19OD2882 TaxID=2794089 RepID=UPI001C1EC9FC|nr:ABC transporter ATP-binding protein [Schaalia sp. 19OD2882]QWW19508.1 ABC transporter ATP-binding protein [Schaalia sp. 19OD2882]